MSHFFFIAAVTGTIIFIVLQHHKERMALIEKGLYRPFKPGKPPVNMNAASLLFGLLATGIGTALLIGSIFNGHHSGDIGTGGLVMLFSGIALLIFWKLKSADRKTAVELYESALKSYGTCNENGVSANDNK